jgi:hypothetical protein
VLLEAIRKFVTEYHANKGDVFGEQIKELEQALEQMGGAE